MIVKSDNQPIVTHNIKLMICWLSDKKLMEKSRKLILKHTTTEVRCIVEEVRYKLDINTLEKIETEKVIGINDIACITIRTTAPIVIDKYNKNRITGSVILIDESSNVTVGAGMII
jgi:sulfate adenylyltransferase subunit 1